MRKVLVCAITLLLLVTPLLAQEDADPTDQVFLEALSKYGERIQVLEGLVQDLKAQPELVQQRFDVLIAQDRFLWTKLQSSFQDLDAAIRRMEARISDLHGPIQQTHLEEIRTLGVIVDLMAQKLQDLSKPVSVDPKEPETQRQIAALEGTITELQANDQFLWKKIQNTAQQLEENAAEIHDLIQSRVAAINQRIRWLETVVESMKDQNIEILGLDQDLQEIRFMIGGLEQSLVNTRDLAMELFFTAQGDALKSQDAVNRMVPQLAVIEEKQQTLEEALFSIHQSIDELRANDRFLWQRIQYTQQQMDAIDQSLNQQIQDRVIAINQRIRWLETVVERLKDDSLSEKQFAEGMNALSSEIQSLKSQLLVVQDMGFEQFLTTQKDTDIVRSDLIKLSERVNQLQTDLPHQFARLEARIITVLEGDQTIGIQEHLQIKEDLHKLNVEISTLGSNLSNSLADLSRELEYVRIEAHAVSLEDIRTIGLLVDLLAARTSEIESMIRALRISDQNLAQTIARISQTTQDLAANDRFLWIRIREIQQQLVDQMNQLEEKTELTLEERFRSVNLRFRWLETQVQKLAQQTPILTQKVEKLETRADQAEQDWTVLLDRIDQIEDSLESSRWASNMRMRWIETQIEQLKTNTANLSQIQNELRQNLDAYYETHQADMARMSTELERSTQQIQTQITETDRTLTRSIQDLETNMRAQISGLALRVTQVEGFESEIDRLSIRTQDLEDRTDLLENRILRVSDAASTAFMVAIASLVVGAIALFK